MSFLGVDIGSSQSKAVVFSHDGKQQAIAYGKYQYTTPEPGAMELDSSLVLPATFQAIREVADIMRNSDPIEAIAASSQGEAFTPVDAHGTPLFPAMISGDSRATNDVDRFADAYGREKLYRITGHTASGMFSLGKFIYLARTNPDVFRQAARFLCFEDLLVYHLTGVAAMGYSLAGRTMLFDVRTHDWDAELLDALHLDASRLSKPQPSGTPVGKILPQVADALHLSRDVLVVTGGHDQIIGSFGCGVENPGEAMYAAGSVECFVPVFEHCVLSDKLFTSNLCTYDFATAGKYASVAYSLTGSNLLEYFLKTFAPDLQNDYSALIASMPSAPTDILAIPYFTPSGTPYFDEKTPGTIYGWRLGTSRGELLKGLEEGIALEMKLNLELLDNSNVHIDKLIATGGGFRNPTMVQLRADVLNRPICLTSVKEAGCRGAAMLAMSACHPDTEIPRPPVIASVLPDTDRAAQYQRKFARWCEFSKAIRQF